MKFPFIHHINDVLGAIADKTEFTVRQHQDYTTVDYQVQTNNTFDSEIARECRGIKFDRKGNIIARPFPKFFNRGERPDLEAAGAVGKPVVMEKVDGSLIHTAYVDGKLVWMSKAGITWVSELAQKYAENHFSADTLDSIERVTSHGWTVMFEYVGPYNRVVIAYPEGMRFLAMRHNVTGELKWSNPFSGVEEREIYPDDVSFDDVKKWTEQEGVVAFYPSTGFMLKMKADDYVLKHKVKDQITLEKNVIQTIMKDEVDDLAGVLDEEDYAKMSMYRDIVVDQLTKSAERVESVAKAAIQNNLERSVIAKQAGQELTKAQMSALWRYLDGRVDSAYEALADALCNAASSGGARYQRAIDDMGITVRWEDFCVQQNEE